MSPPRLSSGVDLEQLRRDIRCSLLCFFSRLLPLIAAQTMERGSIRVSGGIATNQVQRAYWHIQFVIFSVLQQQKLGVICLYLQHLQSEISAYTVFYMDNR